jgi:hypothetical protein
LKVEPPDSPVLDLTVLGETFSIFAISTFDADYVLVGEGKFDLAVDTLRESGQEVDSAGGRCACG